MKRKTIKLITTTLLLSFLLSFSSLAGQWVQEGDRWRYQEYDGTYAKASSDYEPQSYYIDSDGDGFAELYHFDENGYMVADIDFYSGRNLIYNIKSDGTAYFPTGN